MNIKLSIQSKFMIPLSVLVVILLFFGTTLFYIHYRQQQLLQNLSVRIEHTRYISNLLHEIQNERGLSSGVMLNDAPSRFKSRMITQRHRTDAALQTLHANTQLHADIFTSHELHYYENLRKELARIRRSVDEEAYTYKDVILQYSVIDQTLLGYIATIVDYSNIPELTRELLAYIHLSYFKEYRGIERALGVYMFAKPDYTRGDILYFYSYVARQEEHKRAFLTYADLPTKKRFEEEIEKSKAYQEIMRLRKHIYDQKFFYLSETDALSWFELLSNNLNAIHTLSEKLKKKILFALKQRQRVHESQFVIIMAITVFSFFIFLLMIIAFFRLYKEEKKLRQVFEKYIISSITDLKGRIINVSEAFCRISGYAKEELIGKPHNIIRHPDMPPETFERMWKRLKSGKAWSGKIKNRKKDGGFYWVYANIEPLYDSKGNIEAYIAIRLDITKSELLHEKIIQKEKENKAAYEMMLHQSRLAQMGELLSMIAHQWRQPLNSIAVTIATLQRKAQRGSCGCDDIDQTVQRIETLIRHLNQTIEDFRNFFKPDKAKQLTTFTEIVQSVESIIASTLESKGIRFHISVVRDSRFICYKSEMIQVLLNIIKNAEDALTENNIPNGYIALRADNFIVEVEDNAGGIPKEVMPHIFDPYFSTKSQKDGTGLGLYMSKLIVEEHCGGTLSVSNTDQGALFRIDLTHLEQKDRCALLPT